MISQLSDIKAIASRVDRLVFDFDGVLADSDDVHWQAYRLAFEPYGIPFTREDYVESAKGYGRREVVAAFGASLDPLEREDVAQAKTDEAKQLVRAGELKPAEGAIHFIRAARARGILSAVASTSEIAALAVEAMGMTSLFECICAKRAEDRPKPHPDVFLRAFAELERSAERCLVIEDTPTGVRAALAASAAVVVRGRAEEWSDEALRGEISSFFVDFGALHAQLGWGPMESVAG
ncbi:MAG: HAD-IA family hydrolase [bacterium]|nr:HAD-IA family hydrolase [bacterium]